MKQARSEAGKQARIRRQEKAVEVQMALEDRAAARRLMQELAEIERDHLRWAARFKVRVRPDKPTTQTSPVRKRLTLAPMTGTRIHDEIPRAASSWVIDERGMRGVIWQQSYLGRSSTNFYRGAARDNWEYDVRDEAVLLDAEGEPIILSNMGEDWIEIGAAWQGLEDASTRKNAKIQIRVIAPFDADMSQQEMIFALRHFCQTILEPLGLPYSAVIHGPPEGGDKRNFHPHLAFSLRPMQRVEPYCWEVADEVRGELDGKDGVQMLRHLWAHSMSEAAEQARSNRRYTGLGYGARGLDLEAGTHLGEARAAMVKRGAHVWAHERNRIRNARNVARRAVWDADKKIAALTKIRDTAIASMAADRGSTRRVKRLAAARPISSKAPLRRSGRQLLAPAPTVLAIAKPSVAHRPLVATNAITPAQKHPPLLLASSMRVARSSIVATQPLVATRPSERATPSLTSVVPADRAPAPLVASASSAPGNRLTASIAAPKTPSSLTISSMAHRYADRLEAAKAASTPRLKLESSRAPTKPARRQSAAVTTDASFAKKMDELLFALGIARAERNEQEAAARKRVREDGPSWISPFEPDGSPSIALRDLLLTIARAPMQLQVGKNGQVGTRRATEPVRELLDIWREDDDVHPLVREIIKRSESAGRNRWPAAVADVMEAHDRRHPAASVGIQLEPESEPEQPFLHAQDQLGAALDDSDRTRLDRLKLLDAYVADYGGGRPLDIDAPAERKIGADTAWLARPGVQEVLLAMRTEQQCIIAAMAGEAGRRPLDFAKSGVRFWPRDLDPAHLARLDRWAEDPGFQHDMLAIEQRIDAAHVQRERDRRTHEAARRQSAPPVTHSAPVSDGFGGSLDTPATVFTDMGNTARVAAFDRQTNKPTDQLLMLLELAGEHPHNIVFATDGKLMAISGAPPLLAPLLHGWRYDEQVADLVIATVRASREAGHPAWPPKIESAVRAYAARGTQYGSSRPTDLSHGPSR